MIVNVAKSAGFCGGVHRAFIMVQKQFEKRAKKDRRVLILGSLVHNDNVMEIVKSWGIKKIKTMRFVGAGDIVIITAHGVGKQKIEALKDKGAEVFDVTCPFVSNVHKHVSEYYKNNFEIVIFGDRKHKEVRGINGWCGGVAKIVANKVEARKLADKLGNSRSKRPTLVVSQTTQNDILFQEIVSILQAAAKKASRKIVVINTICQATFLRQKEALEVSKRNDAIVVVGGKKSANTKQLWKIAKENNKKVSWIEDLNETTKKEIKNKVSGSKSVCVIAGASTAKWDIDKVEEYLKTL